VNIGLQTWDILVVVVYLVGTTLLGAWFSRGQRDVKTYFVGDRNVPWLLVLVSIVATETSTVTFLSVPGVAFATGGSLTFLQLAFGYALGRIVVAWLLLPQYYRGDLISAYQLLRERFDATVQRTASGLFLVTRTLADGLRLFLTALLLRQFTGWDMTASILVMGVVTVVYTYLGGMQAVIWTDLIQFVIYICGAIVAGVILLSLLPGGVEQYFTVAQSADKFTLFDTSLDPTNPYTLWAGLIGGAFFSMASHGADQIMVQRYLCSRSLNQARLALVSSGVVVFLQFLLFLLIGVGLFVLKQTSSGFAEQITATTRNDEVFGLFIVTYLPPGVVGLVIAAVLAAAMSTLSSSLNSSASAVVSDFYKPWRPELGEATYLRLSRWLTLLFGVAQMVVALAAHHLNSQRSIIDQVLSVAGFTTGLILALFLLGRMKQPVRSSSALLGMIFGLSAVLAVWSLSKVAWPWYAPIGAVTTTTAALLVDRVHRKS
jgi:SSS family transporter